MKKIVISLFLGLTFTVGAANFEPPEIPGWEQDGKMKVFNDDNLFDHINGAAEFYHSYNFQKLWVVRYSKGDAEIALEVYDHGNAKNAFGIYSMERPPEAKVRDIGTQGYYEEAILNFVTGQYYVKMNSYREPDAGANVLLSTARKVSNMLCENPELPEIIEVFPEENLVPNSRQYISNTFMGLKFLGGAYRGKYKTDEGTLTLFVMQRNSKEQLETLLKEYHNFAESEIEEFTEGNYVIEDPFNGTIHLNWKDNYIIGFSGDDLKELRNKLRDKIMDALVL